MNAEKNIIRKAIVSIEYNGKINGPELQQSVNNWWDNIISPEIEALVQRMDKDVFVRIPDLRFDIAVSAAEDWQQLVRRQIVAELEQAIAAAEKDVAAVSIENWFARSKDGAVRRNASQRFFDEWLFFLRNGFIPWWSATANAQEWKTELAAYQEHTVTTDELKKLAVYAADTSAAGRLAVQLSDKLFWQLVDLCSNWEKAYITIVQRIAETLQADRKARPTGQPLLTLKKNILTAVAGGQSQQAVLHSVKYTLETYGEIPAAVSVLIQEAAEVAGNTEFWDENLKNEDTGTEVFLPGEKESSEPHDNKTTYRKAESQQPERPERLKKLKTAKELFAGIAAELGLDIESVFAPLDIASLKTQLADPLFRNFIVSLSGWEIRFVAAACKAMDMLAAMLPEEEVKDALLSFRETLVETAATGCTYEAALQQLTTALAGYVVPGADIKDVFSDANEIAVAAGQRTGRSVITGNDEVQIIAETPALPDDVKDARGIDRNILPILEKPGIAAIRAKSEAAKREQLKKEMYEAAEEGIYIQNAGIVLTAAYLGIFFRNMGLEEDNKINDLPRAIALLHYLATGAETFEEFEVVLAKILCGIEPDEFVDTSYVLTPEDKDEADQLLLAIIGNWTALKSTTPEGLRGTYLVREGRLTHENGSWKLYVQEQPFDILIDMLPWNISMIYLPWMPSLLRVNWRGESI